MARSSLFGRRIHIAGSTDKDPAIATPGAIASARELLKVLVPDLVSRGATFVVPVDNEKVHEDKRPICFDWLVWEALHKSLHLRPAGAHDPFAIAIQHQKSEDQVPEEYRPLWDSLRGSDRVEIKNAYFWNMGAKRLELASQWGDILLTIGGSDGVMFMADLYHQAGKPVIPLPDPLCAAGTGSLRLFGLGMNPTTASSLFLTTSGPSSDSWVNRLNNLRGSPEERAKTILQLLESLQPPQAFAVRLLDDSHPEYKDVQDFFEGVVKPVVEGEMGFTLTVVDGRQRFDHARIDQDIFLKLRRSRLVIADLTGERPNCFLEAGFAIGRELQTIFTCRNGGNLHFDLKTVASHFWNTTDALDQRKRKFREHVEAVRERPVLVPTTPLVS